MQCAINYNFKYIVQTFKLHLNKKFNNLNHYSNNKLNK